MRVVYLICCTLLTAVVGAGEPTSIRKFAEVAHTRVVWVQDHGTANSDILAIGQRLKLMGFDSEDGNGERVVLGELRNYAKPLLTPDGQRVVFSDQPSQKFYVVNWDGSGKKLLGDGLAVDVWRDPADGEDWVYAAKRVGKPENVTYRNLRRVKLSDPKISQKVWDQTDVGCDNFQLSADGTRAGGEFPWPNGGVADLKKKTWQKLETGCWSSIAPDNSGVSWVFDGPHRNLQFHRPDEAEGWKVNVNSAPEINGAEVFHPRWSNHVRFFGMTGPYSVQGKVNVISGGGPQVEVYLGRFSPDFKTVEAWYQVTANDRGDFYPDVWLAGGERHVVDLRGLKNAPVAVAAGTWPVATEGLLFAWNNSAQTNQIPDRPGQPGRACQIQLHGRAVPGRFHDLRFLGGTGTLENLDAELLAAAKSKKSLTVEMLVTPASATSPLAAFCEIGPLDRPYVQLLQQNDMLFRRTKSAAGVTVKEWKTAAPVVVTLTVTPEKSLVYVDGRVLSESQGSLDLGMWTSAEIRLGSVAWRGSVEAVTVYERGLSAEEVERQAAAARLRIPKRKSIVQTRVTAKCIERSTIPPPAQILPYRRALAVHEFEVQKIVADPKSTKKAAAATLKVKDRILVARWVILDGQVLPEAAAPKVGESAEVALELVDEHPELKSERQILDVAELDLPLYYDVREPVNSP
ncbi:MAG: hypothetical protein JWN70_6424 [Planctomycetaceae bacterium]|nr:hypothetical protein [Planctomycetaceae bacterium]